MEEAKKVDDDSQSPTPKKYEQLDNSIGSNKRDNRSAPKPVNNRKSGEMLTTVIKQLNQESSENNQSKILETTMASKVSNAQSMMSQEPVIHSRQSLQYPQL